MPIPKEKSDIKTGRKETSSVQVAGKKKIEKKKGREREREKERKGKKQHLFRLQVTK